MEKIAVYAATRSIYDDLEICLRSLLATNDVDEAVLLIEDDFVKGLWLSDRITMLNVKDQSFFPADGKNYNSRWTYMALMKAVLHDLLPFEKCLMLDCDTIVERDLTELWEKDLAENYYGMVRQQSDGRNGEFMGDKPYYNTGVMLCNLKLLRDGKGDELIHRLNTHYYEYPEQDCINKLCQGKILELPGRYNYCEFNTFDSECHIRHFAAKANWQKTSWARDYADE